MKKKSTLSPSRSAVVAGHPCRPALLLSTIPGSGASDGGREEAGATDAGRHREAPARRARCGYVAAQRAGGGRRRGPAWLAWAPTSFSLAQASFSRAGCTGRRRRRGSSGRVRGVACVAGVAGRARAEPGQPAAEPGRLGEGGRRC
jgi:hypothetical protein